MDDDIFEILNVRRAAMARCGRPRGTSGHARRSARRCEGAGCATKMRDEMRGEMRGEWPKSNPRRFKRTLVLYLTIFIDAI
ncbi:hypothetical protein D8O27_08445 [Burkholderia mallei]|uniref:Uncharacterized protein n=1 Tax=Burkholderia mallei (strain ATCC 23344) TaxID=243160 RepID=A0A0H2WJK9_BURMA|nr:hypothetical protein [Burkholderia mallei]AAU49477.1 hypothetical protein BMA0839 [Burkholderia mallei ATCC 23344]RKO00116.1 hypothetical protein D8O31_08475 [Burkholderia mallei]RKO05005.1 hypothetical protein D8O03_07240 [Burkholderia mallei]RKO13347.1 hypothetical protein D8O04_11835 [Burkholderia mallei]RKO25154.1 hypothetical protein D8O30_06460 [Burkholderia mallei]